MPRLAACRALSSAPGSKGWACTRMFIAGFSGKGSAARHGGEEGDLIALLQPLVEAAQFLIARAHQVLLAEHLPLAPSGQQVQAQVVERAEIAADLLVVTAQRLAVTGEILHSDHASSSSV